MIMPFDQMESEVRSYCRSFPVVFETARGATVTDRDGNDYIDFFAGAGALNYGHNPPELKKPLVDYLMSDGITHSLDMATSAKARFIDTFAEVVLQPRGMDHKVLFPGPTGTNAVEVALKIARKATGRSQVVSFTNGFHGMTLGSLSLTGNRAKRAGARVGLDDVHVMPFDGYHGPDVDCIDLIERLLLDTSSGVELPAAFVLETVQAEGGVRVASKAFMQRLASLAKRMGILLIVDDIQVGCGRTGAFFSFDDFGITPDLICLSKSLSGYGLPMAMVLVRRHLDVLAPGEHNGTFRGHMPAFVTATAALEHWRTDALEKKVRADGQHVRNRLEAMAGAFPGTTVRGRGLIQGIVFADPEHTEAVCREAFGNGLIIETAGPRGEVAKVLPPLVIDRARLDQGLDILEEAVATIAQKVGTPITADDQELYA